MAADGEKLAAQASVAATLRAQFSVLESQAAHEREQSRAQAASAATALAAANAAREQAKTLADQRLAAVHAAEMARTAAEAAVAAMQFQTREVESRLRRRWRRTTSRSVR